jgi:asparagine synthase (glutamine-hydrolysing)
MCGIAGFVFSKFDEDQLKLMTRSLSHRGPDSEGFYCDSNKGLGLGHRRLSILDLSEHGNQPMESHCGRFKMIYNGEIYNYEELKFDLERKWKSSSDSEVILEAFVEYGVNFTDKLNGMFAIAIWDSLDEKLFLFRDRFGIKPLIYFSDGKSFAFASELKSLLSLGLDKKINVNAIKDYFFLEYIPRDQTPFKNYNKLLPGHYLIKEQDQEPKINQYYNLLSKVGRRDVKEEEAKELIKEELKRSINYRQISDVSLGAFLSGGTDSSLICSIFQEQNDKPIETFNIGFDISSFDESVYAKKVAQELKTNHHFKQVTQASAKEKLKEIIEHYDEPFSVPSIIPTSILAEETRKEVTVALSGDGGDELFMGYGYYNWYSRIEKMKKFGGKHGVKLAASILKTMNHKNQRAARVMDLPKSSVSWLHIWSQEQYMFTESEISTLFNQVYEHRTLIKPWNDIDQLAIDPFEKISLFDIQNYLANDLLYKVDIASMKSSLELRVPFLDHNLVEASLNIPVGLKIKEGEQKHLLKSILSDYLSEELVYRKKWGFPAPVGEWMQDDLSYLIDDYLSEAYINKQGIFNAKFVNQLVAEFRAGKAYHHKRIWALICFNMWYDAWA